MFKSYLKIAIRNLIRHKAFSLINVFGLAVGMACTILILLWIKDELSYDKFHKNSDKTYLVLRGDNSGLAAVSSKLLAPSLKEELPEISEATGYMPVPSSIKILMQNDESGFEENFVLADTNFFKIFSFKMKEGNTANALSDPKSVVITESIAEKYFGKENAFGKTLAVTLFGVKHFMKVSGVLENIPSNSHIQSQVIFPVNMMQTFGGKENGWGDQSFEIYIQLKNKLASINDIQKLSLKIKECELKNTGNQNQSLRYSLIPLSDIHLYGNGIKFFETTGDIKSVRIFAAIAIIILLIAGINYMNLSTALSLKRSREVGIKKTIGAGRKSLLLQFFGESLLLSFISMGFALFLVEIFLPGFNQLSGKQIIIRYYEPYFIIGIFLLTIIIGLISGSYPAVFLSSFQPIRILKGNLKIGYGNLITRKGLIIFQFSLSTIIIISTFIVSHQLNFIRNSKLGLDKENLICINMTGDVNSKYGMLKNELRKIPGVISTSRSEAINSSGLSATGVLYRKGNESNSEANSWVLYTDFDLISTYKFQMQQGRFYSENYPTDKTNAFVINEAAAKAMGMKSPLGEDIYLRRRVGKIIGVTKDFHFASFHNVIEPLVFMIPDSSQENGRLRIITIKYKSSDPGEIISRTENIWKEKLPGIPFNYYFYDESLNTLYSSELRMGIIFKCFSFLSIFIACIGLFGLASITTEQRTKEIGIRKVLGASTSKLAVILSKEFLIWIIVSNIIAWPVAYYFMNKWLQDFAYKIEISWWMFALAGGLALVIALATVSFQAIKAATANPVDSLRYE